MSNEMISVPRHKLEAMAFGRMEFDEFSQYMDELQGMLARPESASGKLPPIGRQALWQAIDEALTGTVEPMLRGDICNILAALLVPVRQHQGNAVTARVCTYTPGMGQVELKLPGALPQWLELGETVTVQPGAAQHQNEPDAIVKGDGSIGAAFPPGTKLYTRPAEQPVPTSDQWPKLEKPALVGAGQFSAGLSARLVVEAAQRHYEYNITPENETLRIATGENFLALLAQLEQLRGLRPAVPPRPPEGNGLPRYGLRWNGPQQPLAVPMDDGYWTPWHLANEQRKYAERYQWLRSRDLETIALGGVFAGITPQNMVLNEETLDEAIDTAMANEAQL